MPYSYLKQLIPAAVAMVRVKQVLAWWCTECIFTAMTDLTGHSAFAGVEIPSNHRDICSLLRYMLLKKESK